MECRLHPVSRNQRRHDRNYLASRLPRTPAAGRAVRIEAFHLIANSHGLGHRPGSTDDADANLGNLGGGGRPSGLVRGINADQFESGLNCHNTGQLQPLAHDVQRQSSARNCAGAGIRDLSLAYEAISDIRQTPSPYRGAVVAVPPGNSDAVGRHLGKTRPLRKSAGDVGLYIRGRLGAAHRAAAPCRSQR